MKIHLEIPPVGIKILSSDLVGYEHIHHFHGISYCQALFTATSGKELLITPESLTTCQWSPVVLGFKIPENKFESSITDHLPPGTSGIYMAPVHQFPEHIKPDIVIIRTHSDHFRAIIDRVGWQDLIAPESLGKDATALGYFKSSGQSNASIRLIRIVNRLLDFLNRYNWWHNLTVWTFRSKFVTRNFDKFITRYMANMSMCRNSTVLPFLTQKANISHFCTGGIAWGKNTFHHMTSGFPYKIYQQIEPVLHYKAH